MKTKTQSFLIAYILFFTLCKNKPKESINLIDLHKTLNLTFSFSTANVFTSYIFIKIYEFLDICTTTEGQTIKINCTFDVRFTNNVKTYGICEKKQGGILPIRLQDCRIQISGEKTYAEIQGTVELSKYKVYYENLFLELRSSASSGYIQIINTLSEIFLIESETIRYFKISGSIDFGESFIKLSEIIVRDDGTRIQIKLDKSSIETKGCVNQNSQLSSEGFLIFSENGCAEGGIITKDGEKVTIIGGEIQHEGKAQKCPELPECPFIQF